MTKQEVIEFFGNQVRERRKSLNMTGQELADAIGISRVNVTNMELGNNGTGIGMIWQMCNVLGCQPTDLFPPIELRDRIEVVITKTVLVPTKKSITKTKISAI